MKRVVIKASQWGPGFLLRSNYLASPEYAAGTKCCLGFASLVCGATEAEISGWTLPIHALSHAKHSTNEFREFVQQLNTAPSEELSTACLNSLDFFSDYLTYGEVNDLNIGNILAQVNDAYHKGNIALDQALPILKKGFKEIGLEFIYEDDRNAT